MCIFMEIHIFHDLVHYHKYQFLDGLSSFCVYIHVFIILGLSGNSLDAGCDVFSVGINRVNLEGVCVP